MKNMRLMLNKAQVLVSYLGQKVVLTEEIDCGVLVYPMGLVGVLEAIEMDGKGGARARITFDNDPVQDLMTVSLDDFMPTEFLPEGYQLKDVDVRRNPSLKSHLVTN